MSVMEKANPHMPTVLRVVHVVHFSLPVKGDLSVILRRGGCHSSICVQSHQTKAEQEAIQQWEKLDLYLVLSTFITHGDGQSCPGWKYKWASLEKRGISFWLHYWIVRILQFGGVSHWLHSSGCGLKE